MKSIIRHSVCINLFILLLSFLFILNLSYSVNAAERRTRDLVFEDDFDENLTKKVNSRYKKKTNYKKKSSAKKKSEVKKETVAAVKTTLELTRNKKKKTILPSFKFQSGDKVKFLYTTNIDSYVYWISEGSTGNYYLLFPNSKTGMDNWVKKNEVHKIPVKGNFKFDKTKGVEKILLVMSEDKLPGLDEIAKKGGNIGEDAASVKGFEKKQESKRRTRDLVFDDDIDEDSGISTKSQVSSDTKQPLIVYYELVHN